MTTRESDIVHESGDYWICRYTDRYTVYRSGATAASADSSYPLTTDGLSIAKARCDYLARRDARRVEAQS